MSMPGMPREPMLRLQLLSRFPPPHSRAALPVDALQCAGGDIQLVDLDGDVLAGFFGGFGGVAGEVHGEGFFGEEGGALREER